MGGRGGRADRIRRRLEPRRAFSLFVNPLFPNTEDNGFFPRRPDRRSPGGLRDYCARREKTRKRWRVHRGPLGRGWAAHVGWREGVPPFEVRVPVIRSRVDVLRVTKFRFRAGSPVSGIQGARLPADPNR